MCCFDVMEGGGGVRSGLAGQCIGSRGVGLIRMDASVSEYYHSSSRGLANNTSAIIGNLTMLLPAVIQVILYEKA